jgi:hypothetical protein
MLWLAERQYLALSASLEFNFSVGLNLTPTAHGESRIKDTLLPTSLQNEEQLLILIKKNQLIYNQ